MVGRLQIKEKNLQRKRCPAEKKSDDFVRKKVTKNHIEGAGPGRPKKRNHYSHLGKNFPI